MYFDMDKRGIQVEELPPSEMLSAISEGRLQGGLVPLVDTFDLDESLRTVSGFCIATITRVPVSGRASISSRKPSRSERASAK